VSKPTVHIQMVEAAAVTSEDLIVRNAVSIQLDVEGKRFERIITLPRNEDELRLFGFVPLTRD
jgi:hypothetical protein